MHSELFRSQVFHVKKMLNRKVWVFDGLLPVSFQDRGGGVRPCSGCRSGGLAFAYECILLMGELCRVKRPPVGVLLMLLAC